MTWPSQIITSGRLLPEVNYIAVYFLISELLSGSLLLLLGSLLLLPELLSLLVPVLPCEPAPVPVSGCTPKCAYTCWLQFAFISGQRLRSNDGAD